MPDLAPIDESWSTALCVVAHPDDLEFGAAAAVARWTEAGKSVSYAMITSGEAGIDGLAPDECRRVREAEQVESAKLVGVDVVEFLGLPDGILEYGVALRRVICGMIRKHRPEIVITNNFRETWGGRSLNQADHIVTGRATVDAVSDAANRWIFPEQLTEGGLEPWRGVQGIWAANSPQSDQAVDTSATFERGVASLAAHQAYIAGLGWEHFDPAEFLEGLSRSTGTRLGVPMAVAFEVFPTGWGD
jgi:LmbE family N-acetylglucosaminyl deacetylase